MGQLRESHVRILSNNVRGMWMWMWTEAPCEQVLAWFDNANASAACTWKLGGETEGQ